MNTNPIGIFDSGLGGLTVLKALKEKFPKEKFIYVGDTAHLPYGSKSSESITNYSIKIANYLTQVHNVKMIIIACHSASSIAYQKLTELFDVPIIDVIIPTCNLANQQTKSNNIAVLGTAATITSKSYSQALTKINNQLIVDELECPLFVPLVEEGLEDSILADNAIDLYLHSIKSKNIDTIILGCTHYPILKNKLSNYLGEKIQIINTAKSVANQLIKLDLLLDVNISEKASDKYFVTDFPIKFDIHAKKFLGTNIIDINHLVLE